jgi:hypothetical protein
MEFILLLLQFLVSSLPDKSLFTVCSSESVQNVAKILLLLLLFHCQTLMTFVTVLVCVCGKVEFTTNS